MIDFQDPAFLQDPYPVLNEARESTPAFPMTTSDDGPETWFLTRHDDVARTLHDRQLGRTIEHVISREGVGLCPVPAQQSAFADLERWSMLQLEPPEHTRIRRLLAHEFTPRRVSALAPHMDNIVERLLDDADPTSFELLSDLAQPFSLLVMCELLGAPYEDQELLLGWSHAIVKMYELDTTEAQALAAERASADFSEWTLDLISQRRAEPKDDLISGLCRSEAGGEALSDAEIVSTVVLLLNAGHEASVNTLGNGITALLRAPSEMAKLQSGEVEWLAASEELFRFDSPLQLFERWVLADHYEVAGMTLPRGSKIAVLLGSANRDPRKWDRPDTFDITRGDTSHVAFGRGIHHCIGAGLARLEVSTVLNRLVTRFPNMQLTSDPIRNQAFVIHGYKSVNLTLE